MGCKPSTARLRPRSSLPQMSRGAFPQHGHYHTDVSTEELPPKLNKHLEKRGKEKNQKNQPSKPSVSLQIQGTQESVQNNLKTMAPTAQAQNTAKKEKNTKEGQNQANENKEMEINPESEERKVVEKVDDFYVNANHQRRQNLQKERRQKRLEKMEREKGKDYVDEIIGIREDKQGRRMMARMNARAEDDTLYEVYGEMPTVYYSEEIQPLDTRGELPAKINHDVEAR
ncbi:unnamed protein product [Bursaphelenchus xylophilus]|uniref:(pine wood nematode) hypothetical protein n=1 Tax=Bursaphelenchus xylophilus TaxID=6326 RepID=A0A1I7RSP9_BURXY|nr:unnamed protein product [Bursaphelenchus xylophilus]CAG9122842.1 unnamed protein product [Bursaphelenchus xylophilus]